MEQLTSKEKAVLAIIKGRKITYFNGMQELETGYIDEARKNSFGWDLFYIVYKGDKRPDTDFNIGGEGDWRIVPPRAIVGIENTKDKVEKTWLTIAKKGESWDELPQIYLGEIAWETAVKIAKSQSNATRLCNSEGYNNEGHYV